METASQAFSCERPEAAFAVINIGSKPPIFHFGETQHHAGEADARHANCFATSASLNRCRCSLHRLGGLRHRYEIAA